jgi:beta-glucosidase
MARELGDVVSSWITINEPAVVAFLGHAEGVKAPGVRDWPTAVAVSHHLLLAHGLAARAISEERPGAEVGISLNLAPVYPDTSSPEDTAAAERLDGHLNRWFLDPLLRARYPEDMVELYERELGPFEALREGDLETIAAPLPFLGVNYYSPLHVRADASRVPLGAATVRKGEVRTAMGWEVVPEGLHELLSRLRDEYGNPPVYITENGAAFDDPAAVDGHVEDPRREAYLRDHVAAVRRAMADGVDVRRYCVWSLLDNFEWEHGYAPRFGIVYVDYETQRRIPKASALWYRDYIRSARDGAG